MPQTTAMLYSVVCITYTWTVSRFLLNSRRLETCLHSQALCAHCWSADFKTRHHGFDVLPASRDSKGIMQTLRDALCVGQRALNPRTCTGVVVATERPTWRLQRGCLGELVCNDQVVKSHASLDDDGSPTNRQSNGPLQDPPLVHQHPERTLNCHSQRTMVEGEDAFVGAHVANVGSQYRCSALVCSVSQEVIFVWNTAPCDGVSKAAVCKCPRIVSRTWHVYGAVCVSFVSVTDGLHVESMKAFAAVIQSRLTDLLDSGLPYFRQNTVQRPQRIKKNFHVRVLSLLETVHQFLQDTGSVGNTV